MAHNTSALYKCQAYTQLPRHKPRIANIFVQKDFIGGCDIVVSMHQNGDLAELLEKEGVLAPPEPESSESASSPGSPTS